ncbi:MAG TPA: hypothetical protein VK750_01040 [Cytophagaceae bacterium]|jgi:hypothetical protein|nr:hypothetical protein [Cytophagaceae bacterium]
MNKKILVVYYTQTGQLQEIVENFSVPLVEKGIVLETMRIYPEKDFGFPWTSDRFFDAMPESVNGTPAPLLTLSFKEQSYDLVIIAYQPWFLSPSIPTTSLLHDAAFKKIIKDTPVVTLIGARNMWLNAQEKMKKLLTDAGAHLVGNIALVDKNGNLTSAVTILHWMLKGRKDRKYGIFPIPGIAEDDIKGAHVFGSVVLDHLSKTNWNDLQADLIKAKAVEVDSDLMFIEQRAGRLFSIWSRIVTNTKNRKAWLVVFKYYLVIALFIVAPLVLFINNIVFRPFVGKSIRRKKEYYLGVN